MTEEPSEARAPKGYWVGFLQRWRIALTILFDPFVVLCLGISVAGVIISFGQTDANIKNLLLVFIGIATSFLGARAYAAWQQINERGLLEIRGESAVGSLNLIWGKLGSLRARLVEWKEAHGDSPSPELTREIVREVEWHLVDAIEAVINSIDDWRDIVPGTDLRRRMGQFRKLEAELTDAKRRAEEAEDLVERGRQNEQAQKTAEDKLAHAQAQVERLQKQIQSQRGSLALTNTPYDVTPYGLGSRFAESMGLSPRWEDIARTLGPQSGLGHSSRAASPEHIERSDGSEEREEES